MSIPVLLLVTLLIFHQTDQHPLVRSSSATTCVIQHNKRTYREGETIKVGKKSYKVEDCQLQRAYQGCGSPLWFMITTVCAGVERQKAKDELKDHQRRFTPSPSLTDSCCENFCTISEMTRYCAF
jgi:hypothetical protein